MILPRATLPAVAVLLTLPALLPAQEFDHPWDSVTVSWDRGDYPDALTRLERLLSGPAADRYLERAALLTGELFVTTELAPDGRLLRWSPGGRYAAWELGTGNERRTVIARIGDDGSAARVAELQGYALAFAPGDGFAAYVTRGGVVRDVALASLAEREIPTPGLRVRALAYASDGTLLATAGTPQDTAANIHALGPETPVAMTSGSASAGFVAAIPNGLVYTIGRDRIAVARPGRDWNANGTMAAVSASGTHLAFVHRDSLWAVIVMPIGGDYTGRVVHRSSFPVANPALSANGDTVAWQMMPREDWEIYVAPSDASAPARRLTREIQHDIFPQFLSGGLLLEKLGEGRHRRSYVLDVATGARRRFFHNNTVRTISSEYQWVPSPDGNRVMISADRDGNTVSPERGVYLVDLNRRVTVDDVRRRVSAQLAAERELRALAERIFRPIAPRVRSAVAEVSVERIDRYAHDLFQFDSKNITQPGNRLAIEYLAARLRSFGYQPELQEFEPRPGIRSANVIATLRGTADPDVTYVVGSHFDSVEGSPGGDDDSSSSTMLLETARVLATRPQRATVKFVFFTAEESGLLGARHFARRAQADSLRVVGALNNDMIGWMNDHRLDNTIRHFNDGLREVQHAAALQFSNLITYDSRYYQSTDAQALADVYGDIIGGIGSYPVLGNPHYHQTHDVLETIDMRLVAEVAKTTIATVMLMASSPSRLNRLAVAWNDAGAATATWQRAVERGVTGYRVRYGPADNPSANTTQTRATRVTLPGVEPGWVVEVKALLPGGLESWDWARAVIPAR